MNILQNDKAKEEWDSSEKENDNINKHKCSPYVCGIDKLNNTRLTSIYEC